MEWWELPEKVIEDDPVQGYLGLPHHAARKLVITNEPDIVVVDKYTKYTAVIDVAVRAQ